MIPHISVSGRTIPESYHKALEALLRDGDMVDCPDWNTTCVEASATIQVSEPLSEPMISSLSICDPYSLEKYRMEMVDGLLDWSVEAGLEPYTYHQRIAGQMPKAVKELKRSKDSRRAAVTIRMPSDYDLPDAPCLQHLQFVVRNDALDMFVLFRSNDAVKATFMNMFGLAMIQKEMAEAVGCGVGGMLYTANSFHCYQRDFHTLRGYVRAMHDRDCTYEYVGEWDSMMADERAKILSDVEKQKKNRGLD